MAIPPYKDEFNSIITGLQTKDHRVAFAEGRFKDITTKDKSEQSDLGEVSTAIQKFVKDNQLESQDLKKLEQALEKRATDLTSRTTKGWKRFFMSKSTKQKINDQAALLLHTKASIPELVDKRNAALQQQVQALKEEVDRLKLQLHEPEKKALLEPGPSSEAELEGKEEGPPPQQAPEPAPGRAPPPAPGGAPPPAPLGGGGPPPPPAMIMAKATGTHTLLIDDADKLIQLKNEPKRPQLQNKEHDFGKTTQFPKYEAPAREAYIKQITEFLPKYSQAIEELEEPTSQWKELQTTVTNKEGIVKEAENKKTLYETEIKKFEASLKENSKCYGEIVTSKQVIKVPFYPQKMIDELKKKIKADPTKQSACKALSLNPDEIYSIEDQIKTLKEEIKIQERDIKNEENELKNINTEKAKIEKSLLDKLTVPKDVNRKSPKDVENFINKFSNQLETRKKIATSWKNVQKNLETSLKKGAGLKEIEVPQVEAMVSESAETIFDDPDMEVLSEFHTLVKEPSKTESPGLQGQIMKKAPAFYATVRFK